MQDKKIIEDFIVEKMVYGGYGFGFSSEGKPVFVEGAYTGEIVDIEITQEKKSLMYAKPIERKLTASFRNAPVCKVYDKCGGCDWLDADYEKQLEFKKDMIIEQFERIAKMDIRDKTENVVASPEKYQMRNKIEYEIALENDKVVIGLKEKHSRNIVPTFGCKVIPSEFEKIRKHVEDLLNAWEEKNVYDRKKRRGNLKHLVIRKAFHDGNLMVIFVTHKEYFNNGKKISHELRKKFPQITSVIHVMNSSDKIALRGPYKTIYGAGVLYETVEWAKYHIPPISFFQVNTSILKPLLNTVKDLLSPEKNQKLLDLYGGSGLFSVYLAPLFSKVKTVEFSHASARIVAKNASVNEVTNLKSIESDVELFLREETGKYDAIIVDPPKSGLNDKVISHLMKLSPDKLLYISCDPSTLARDTAKITEEGYEIKKIVPFDMFPHTYHVETVVLMEKAKTI